VQKLFDTSRISTCTDK